MNKSPVVGSVPGQSRVFNCRQLEILYRQGRLRSQGLQDQVIEKMKAGMKHMVIFYLLISVFIAGCIPEPTKKLYIRSIKVSEDIRIDWYVYSSISSLAPDYLQISTNDKEPFFVSFFLTGIHLRNDSLFISLSKDNYEKLDRSKLKEIMVSIDTIGESWNSASSRFGRLKGVGVNIEAPHFIDAYCPHGECNNFDISPHYK